MKAKLFLIFSFLSMVAYGQQQVQGKVSDEKGQPLPGVSVVQKGTTNGTVTDVDGAFTLQNVPEDAFLVFSFIGYESQEVARTGKSTFNINLVPDVKTLEEVVVVGYGTQKKSVATASLSKVDAKDLSGFSTARVDQMLQGQVAGVTFKTSSGQPGSGLNIFIRGIGSNGDNSPLVIVDGVVVNDGILQSLNPADIESIQVLKDGASTAIYGARGANGIIQVTTKSAKEGKTSFSYSGNYGVQQPWRLPTMLNSTQYVDLITEKYQNGGSALPAGFPTQNSITANTDWMDKVFSTGSTQSHVLSIANGTKAGSLNASLSYFDQKGVIAPEKSYFKRITGRLNTEQKVNNFLTFGENMFLVHSTNGRIPENSEFGTPIGDALVYDPTTPANNPGQQYGFAQSPFVQKEYINPLSRIFISNTTNNTDEVTGNVYLKVTPAKNLTFRTDAGLDYIYYTGKGFQPSYAFTPAFFNTVNDIYQYETKVYRWQWENVANYTKSIGKHNAALTAGTTVQLRNNGIGFSASSSGINEDVQFDKNFWYITNTPDSLQRAGSFGSEKQTMQSVFGRVNYNYDEKYLVSLTFRRDGSSQFGPNNRYGNFPSASIGWVASKETFFPQTFVNFAKLRASYGVNGNDRIQSLAYAAIIQRTGTYPFGKPGSQTIFNGQS
jgi:TonB-linked SusC/RagA family outer membrane protein